jgi:hypothetical protein
MLGFIKKQQKGDSYTGGNDFYILEKSKVIVTQAGSHSCAEILFKTDVPAISPSC